MRSSRGSSSLAELVRPESETRTIDVDGQLLRVLIKTGRGTPLLIFNGIGASLELLAPFIHALGDVEVAGEAALIVREFLRAREWQQS
jgi:hypothetical protein